MKVPPRPDCKRSETVPGLLFVSPAGRLFASRKRKPRPLPRRVQHILNKYPIPRRRIIHKKMRAVDNRPYLGNVGSRV